MISLQLLLLKGFFRQTGTALWVRSISQRFKSLQMTSTVIVRVVFSLAHSLFRPSFIGKGLESNFRPKSTIF